MPLFFFTFSPKEPSQARRWFLMHLEVRSNLRYARTTKCKLPKSHSKATMKQQVICGFKVVFAHKASIDKKTKCLHPFCPDRRCLGCAITLFKGPRYYGRLGNFLENLYIFYLKLRVKCPYPCPTVECLTQVLKQNEVSKQHRSSEVDFKAEIL